MSDNNRKFKIQIELKEGTGSNEKTKTYDAEIEVKESEYNKEIKKSVKINNKDYEVKGKFQSGYFYDKVENFELFEGTVNKTSELKAICKGQELRYGTMISIIFLILLVIGGAVMYLRSRNKSEEDAEIAS